MVKMVKMVNLHTRLTKILHKSTRCSSCSGKADAALKGLNEADTEAAIQAAKDANPVATQEQWLSHLKVKMVNQRLNY